VAVIGATVPRPRVWGSAFQPTGFSGRREYFAVVVGPSSGAVVRGSQAMTRCVLFVICAVVLGALGRNAQADDFKPEEIIEKAIRAHGGEDRLKVLSGFRLKERRIYARKSRKRPIRSA
jgi:hypothetical protein